MSRDPDDLAVWQKIARMTNNRSFYLGAPRIRVGGGLVRVSPGWNQYAGVALLILLIAFGVGLTGLAYGQVIILTAGIAGVGLLCVTWPTLRWQSGGSYLGLRYGWFALNMHQLEVSRRSLRVRMRLIPSSDADRDSHWYKCIIELRRFDVPADCVRVAIGKRDKILPLYEMLKEFLGDDRAVDLSCDHSDADSDTAGQIEVSRAPLGQLGPGSETARFVWRTRDLALLRPTLRTRLVLAIFLCAGCLVLRTFVSPDMRPEGIAGCALAVVVGVLFTLIGLWGVLFGLQTHYVSVDRTRREIRFRAVIPGMRQRTFGFSQVYALQLCSTYEHGDGDSPNSMGYELNVVFADPPGLRRTLLCNKDLGTVRQQANMLSDAMQKPLLDHTEGITVENMLRRHDRGGRD